MTTGVIKVIEVEKDNLKPNSVFFELKNLPIRACNGSELLVSRSDWNSWERNVCNQILKHWKDLGCIVLYEKENMITTIVEAYDNMTAEQANEILESLIQKEVFREEREWLVPLKPLLRCATDRAVEKNFSWCLVDTYRNISISLA
ncbi:hypothetical protein D4R86_00680 [bacterium]|nr:MAG: hypothetical protein D4R86_00680 [bacterium]